jgi:hypothetical protein
MKAKVSKTLSGEEVEWKVDCATAVWNGYCAVVGGAGVVWTKEVVCLSEVGFRAVADEGWESCSITMR